MHWWVLGRINPQGGSMCIDGYWVINSQGGKHSQNKSIGGDDS